MIGTYSCEKKLKSECIKTLNFADKSVVSGKFVFSSTLSLREAIDDLRTTDIELVEDKFERLYNEGFRSHKPIVGPDNIDLIKTLSMEKNDQLKDYYMKYPETKSDSQDENPLEFIPDPFFAAFVNENNEIIVNDTLYVITKNDGMYFAHINDSTHLYNYLNENGYGANSDNGSKSLSIEEDPCIVREEYGGVTEVDEEISRYIAPLDECYEEDPYYDGGNPPSYPETSVEEILQDRINNLPVMPASGANIIKNLFGDAFSTTVNFDDRNRIKTEFWDCKYFIYASVGVLAKTQKRTLGIWWASKSDELHLGINRVYLKYHYPMPKITVLTPIPTAYNNYNGKTPLYMYDGTFQYKTPDGYPAYIDATLKLENADLPYFPLEDKNLLNIYIPYEGGTNVGISTGDILSSSNIKKLYKLGIDFLKKLTISDSEKEFAVTFQKNPTEIEVIYFGERYSEQNENKINRLFYSDVNFVIGYTTNLQGTSSFSIKPINEFFRNYTEYEVDMYGMAKRDYVWKGMRMIK